MILRCILQIFLLAVFLGVLLRSSSKSKLDWLFQVLVLGSFLLFIILTARWDFSSYYLRILVVPLFGIAAYIAFRKIVPASASANQSPQWIGLAVNGALLLVATWLNAHSGDSASGNDYALDIVRLNAWGNRAKG